MHVDSAGEDSEEEGSSEEEVQPDNDPVAALMLLYRPLFEKGEGHMLAFERKILELEVRVSSYWLVALHAHCSQKPLRLVNVTLPISGASAGVPKGAK